MSIIERAKLRYAQDGLLGLASALKWRLVVNSNPNLAYWRMVSSRPYNKLSQVLPGGAAICITEACNLACSYCARSTVPPVGDMSFSSYKRLVKSLWWCRRNINIIGLGEQLLHPEIVEILEWTMHERKIPVTLSTNGMVDLEKNERLTELLLDCRQIQFSIDTTNELLLNKIRTGANFRRIERNLAFFLDEKKKRIDSGSHAPIVNINSVLTAETFFGMLDLIKYAASLGLELDYLQLNSVTLADYQHAHAPLFGTKRESFIRHRDEAIDYVQSHKRLCLAKNDRDFLRLRRRNRGKLIILGLVPDRILTAPTSWSQCRSIYSGSGIRPNGDIYICCYRPDLKLGNAFTDNFLAAWNGPVARSFREQVLTDNPPACCPTCNFAYEGTYPRWAPNMPMR